MTLRSFTLALGAVLLTGCSKDGVQTITTPVTGAQIRFANLAVAAPPATAVPAVNFFANDAKLTAITSGTGQESTLGTGTGLAGNSGLYSVLAQPINGIQAPHAVVTIDDQRLVVRHGIQPLQLGRHSMHGD